MRKLSFVIIASAFFLASCGKGDVVLTVKFTGTEYDGNIDVFVGVAVGAAYMQSQFDALTILEKHKFTPSENEQSRDFIVKAKESYTPFVFHDLNQNGSYDAGETVRLGMSVVYIEEDTEVSISYNY